MGDQAYRQLAEKLDALPNGYPSTPDGVELRILERIFEPDEARLGALMKLSPETVQVLAERMGESPDEVKSLLKAMAKKDLVLPARIHKDGKRVLGFSIRPFFIGFYESQLHNLDQELADLVERYFESVHSEALVVAPQHTRVLPVQESIPHEINIEPYETAAAVVGGGKAWSVLDCICRVQQKLIGKECEYPVDVCMVISQAPGYFDNSEHVRALTKEEALATLKRAADAGLVHTTSNQQEGLWFICSCCTCCCGILRGAAELGAANVVARSAFVNKVDDSLCIACALCADACPFEAIEVLDVAEIDDVRCVGCGVCISSCPEEALVLVRRDEADIEKPPLDWSEWAEKRSTARGLDLSDLL
ncbi:MAG: 4Fe-4S binding protein [Chloroflexota bacterium]